MFEKSNLLLVVCQFCFEGFLVVRASCPRERDAHTTVHHFYVDRLLVQYGVNKATIQKSQKPCISSFLTFDF
jgi:hypothetical protein